MSEERKVTNNVHIEGAQLIYKNFKGKQTQYNAEGNRNFGVLLDDDLAARLAADGWNVKHRRPREDDPDQYQQPWLPVKVKFGDIPPIAILINSRGKVRLNEETIDQLDWSRIQNCDLIIRPYNYPSFGERSGGVAAYLKAIYVTVEEDEFEKKYSNIPDLDREPLPFGEEQNVYSNRIVTRNNRWCNPKKDFVNNKRRFERWEIV